MYSMCVCNLHVNCHFLNFSTNIIILLILAILTILVLCAGGRQIQEECDRYVRKHGEVRDSHLYISKPGTLPCRHICHAVGPVWQGGRAGEENVLFDTIYRCMGAADSKGSASIAFPVLCAGNFAMPVKRAVKMITEAISEYLVANVDKTSLREIFIVDVSQATMDEFKSAAVIVFGSKMKTSDEMYADTVVNSKLYHLKHTVTPAYSSTVQYYYVSNGLVGQYKYLAKHHHESLLLSGVGL